MSNFCLFVSTILLGMKKMNKFDRNLDKGKVRLKADVTVRIIKTRKDNEGLIQKDSSPSPEGRGRQ